MRDIDEIRRDNLKLLQAEAGSPTAAAKLLDMELSQFSQLRDGAKDSKTGKPRGMRKTTARSIDLAAGKPQGWLDEDHGDHNTSAGPDLVGMAPVISWVQAGAHREAIASSDAEEWVKTTVTVRPGSTFALRVKGDSMEPVFPSGVIIVVEQDFDPQPGDYVIASNGNNEATFKQLVRDGGDLYLKPLNDRYPVKPLGAAKIVGVVRESIQKFR